MAITIKDVAKKAGVSVATVSRVVNQKDIHKVGLRTQERIGEILKEIGYHPNTMARGLKTHKTFNVGVVFFWYEKPTFADFYLARVLDGITNFLSEKKYNILMNTFSRQIGQEHVYTNFVNSGLLDGIIAIAPPVESTFFHDLKEGTLPYVLISYQVNDPKICFVDCLNTQGVIDAVDHLMELGHKRIGYISGDIQFSKNNLDRFNAFKFILKKRNLTFREEHTAFGNWSEENGAAAVEAFWKTKQPPTALLAAGDIMAIGAIKQLEKKGLKVPNDVAVIGFDDLPFQTTLTTVHQPVFDMGFEGAKMLWNQIEKKPLEYTQRLFPMRLVVRESCGFYLKETANGTKTP